MTSVTGSVRLSATAFAPIPLSNVEYRRPMSPTNMPSKFSADATVDVVLRGAIKVLVNMDGSLETITRGKSSNFLLDLSEVDLSNGYGHMTSTLEKYRSQIYGIRISASQEEFQDLDRFVEYLVKFGFLLYLVDLDLSYLTMPSLFSGFSALCSTLNPRLSGYCPIKRLVLTRCGLGPKGITTLFDALVGNIFIEELFVSGNKATDEAMKSVAKFLANSKLRSLAIGDNSISVEGIKDLCPSLVSAKYLRCLQLNKNQIGDDGATEVILAIRDADVLEELNLSNCGLYICAWSHRIRIMSSLSYLNVSHNKIDDLGLQELCEGLEQQFCLRHLDVSCNKFNGQVCKCLGRLLEANKGLSTLVLTYNYMKPEVWANIGYAMQINNTLQTLDLRWCELTPAEVEPILEALVVNEVCNVILDSNPLPVAVQRDSRSAPKPAAGDASPKRSLRLKSIASTREQTGEGGELQLGDGDGGEREEGRANSNAEPLTLFVSSSQVQPKPLSAVSEMTALCNGFEWRSEKMAELAKSKVAVEILGGLSLLPSNKSAAAILEAGGLGAASEEPADGLAGAGSGSVTASSAMSLAERSRDGSVTVTSSVMVNPATALVKALRRRREAADAAAMQWAQGQRIITVAYGRVSEDIGTITVSDTTTYYQARDLVRPLISEYLGGGGRDPASIQYLLNEFSFFDNDGNVLTEQAMQMKVLWVDASVNSYTVVVRPGNWISLPPGDDDDEENDEDI